MSIPKNSVSVTPEPDASPCSTPTATLKQWQDHVRLSQLIIRELGNEDRNGVLGRWMAQRVAELLRRAEASVDPAVKEAAERECQDLIIRLWESRESRPEENQLIGWITNLLQLQRKELRYFCLAIRDQIPAPLREEMRQLLAEHQSDLSEEEANILYFVTNASQLPFFNQEAAVEIDGSEIQEETTSASTAEPVDRLAEFLAFITKERQQFFARVSSSPPT